MNLRLVTIDQITYAVSSAEGFAHLKSEVVAAALKGAGLVKLPLVSDRNISVVITPHQLITFEERTIDDEEPGDETIDPACFDC